MANSLPSSSLEQLSNSTKNDEVVLSPDQTEPTVTQGKLNLFVFEFDLMIVNSLGSILC